MNEGAMDYHLGEKAVIYLDEKGCFSSQKTDREVEVDIVVVDEYNPHHELFVAAKELDDSSDDETIIINQKYKDTWDRGHLSGIYNYVDDIDNYFGQRGSWTTSTYLFPSSNNHVASVAKKRDERPCQSCQRMNDMGVHECWWCGNDPHKGYYR
jgi:hypothetical protein